MKIRTVITKLAAWHNRTIVMADEPEKLLTAEDRGDMILQISTSARVINEKFIDDPKFLRTIDVQGLMSGYPDKTIIAVHEYLTPELDDPRQEQDRMEFILNITMMQYRGTDSISIREYLAFLPSIRLAGIGIPRALKMIRALHTYPQLPAMYDFSDADDRTKQQIMGIFIATALMHEVYEDETRGAYASRGDTESFKPSIPLEASSLLRINDEDLVSLIVERPGQVQEIINIYRERGSDTGLIRDIMDSAAQPLREGVL